MHSTRSRALDDGGGGGRREGGREGEGGGGGGGGGGALGGAAGGGRHHEGGGGTRGRGGDGEVGSLLSRELQLEHRSLVRIGVQHLGAEPVRHRRLQRLALHQPRVGRIHDEAPQCGPLLRDPVGHPDRCATERADDGDPELIALRDERLRSGELLPLELPGEHRGRRPPLDADHRLPRRGQEHRGVEDAALFGLVSGWQGERRGQTALDLVGGQAVGLRLLVEVQDQAVDVAAVLGGVPGERAIPLRDRPHGSLVERVGGQLRASLLLILGQRDAVDPRGKQRPAGTRARGEQQRRCDDRGRVPSQRPHRRLGLLVDGGCARLGFAEGTGGIRTATRRPFLRDGRVRLGGRFRQRRG